MGAKCVLPPPLWSDCVLAGSKGWLAPEHTTGDVLIGRWCRAGHALVCQMPGFLRVVGEGPAVGREESP